MTITALKCSNLKDLENVARHILEVFHDQNIFLLSGKMGAGKTTLIKEMCRVLNVVDVVNSPTFSIVNEYRTNENKSVFHFDLYRIKSPEELMDIGYEEYIYSNSVCFIEWPELATTLMPPSYVMIQIEADPESQERYFQISLENNTFDDN